MNEPAEPATPPPSSTGTELSSMDDQPAVSGTSAEDAPSDPLVSVMAESPPAESQAATITAEPTLPDPVPHAGARYAGLRLLMLLSVGGVLHVAGMRGWLLAFAAVLISGVVSLFLLMKQRNDAAVNLERTVEGWKQRHDHEDAGLVGE